MKNAMEAMLTRRSIRKFKPDMVPREMIDQILEAGTYAKIMGSDTDPFYGAPVILIVLADKNVPTHVYDGSLVMGNLMLAAHALGLGSCWIHRAKEEFESPQGKAFLQSLGIEGDYEGIGHCAIGYADMADPRPAPRKKSYLYYVE